MKRQINSEDKIAVLNLLRSIEYTFTETTQLDNLDKENLKNIRKAIKWIKEK